MGKVRLKPGLYIISSISILLIIAIAYYLLVFVPKHSAKYLNVQYGSNPEQKLDIYVPNVQNGSELPVIVYVHGGGWRAGSRTDVSSKPAFFNEKGYVFVSVEHRFLSPVTYDKMAEDISSAVKWVYTHASQYHIDQNRINLMGHSSGGHLIMLIGTNPYYLNQVGLAPNALKSVVSLEGPLNIAYFASRSSDYKEVFGNDQRAWVKASPETYAANKNLPPMLFVARQARSVSVFVEMTIRSGNKADIYEVKNLTHNQVSELIGSTNGSADAQYMTKAIIDFLNHNNL